MTIKFDNVYVKETSTVAGKFESEGPLSKTFDKTYNDFYMGEKSFEQGEIKMILDSIFHIISFFFSMKAVVP